MSHRRVVQTVTPEDAGTAGRPYLHAYGRRWLAKLAGVHADTVRAAIKAGLRVGDPVQAVCWALERRGWPDLAQRLRWSLEGDL